MKKLTKILLLFFIAGVLAACSSGGGEGDPPGNTLTSRAGNDRFVQPGDDVTLDGSTSSHSNAAVTITGYSWTQVGGPNVTLNNADTATPSFTAPNVTATTALVFQLTVSASNGDQATDTVMITVTLTPVTNQPPSADAGVSQSVAPGATVTLNGNASSDPDPGDSITSYAWIQTGGNNVTLQNENTAVATFTAPAVNSTLTFQLTVEDSNGAQDTATVTVTVSDTPPVGPYIPIGRMNGDFTSSSLHVIDTENPASIIPIEQTTVEHFQTFNQTDYDSTTQTISNLRPQYMFYWKDSRFWRVLLEAGSDLVPQQVSSDLFDNICNDAYSPNDQVNLLDTAILVETAGADNGCYGTQAADNVIRIIRLGFNSTQAAIDATGIFPGIGDRIAVLDDGFLNAEGNFIRRYDANLTNPVEFGSVTDPATVYFSEKSGDNQFVFIDGELRHIDLSTNTLNSGSLLTIGLYIPSTMECDLTDCYFAVKELDNTLSIYKVPVNGSANATMLVSGIASPNTSLRQLQLTANYLFYTVDETSGSESLYQFPKNPAMTDTPLLVDSGDKIATLFTSLDMVYYNVQTVSGSSITASTVVISDQALASPQTYTDSVIVGLSDYVFSYASLSLDGVIFVANGATDITAGVGGASLQSYSLSDGMSISTLGDIPAEIITLYMFNSILYGENRFVIGITASSGTISQQQSDVFVVNPAATELFTNITNTPDQFEFPDLL